MERIDPDTGATGITIDRLIDEIEGRVSEEETAEFEIVCPYSYQDRIKDLWENILEVYSGCENLPLAEVSEKTMWEVDKTPDWSSLQIVYKALLNYCDIPYQMCTEGMGYLIEDNVNSRKYTIRFSNDGVYQFHIVIKHNEADLAAPTGHIFLFGNDSEIEAVHFIHVDKILVDRASKGQRTTLLGTGAINGISNPAGKRSTLFSSENREMSEDYAKIQAKLVNNISIGALRMMKRIMDANLSSGHQH